MLKTVLLVGIGGGVGSVLRYLLGQWVRARLESGFPYGTLLINVLGCFLIGVALSLAVRNRVGPETHVLLATGLCGGFTTFSAFSLETLTLLRDGQVGYALLYAGLSMVAGLGATAAGLTAGRWW